MQLLKAGLFPCSPQHPSLAVDLQVLDFVTRLFLNLPPSNTVFCNTLEGFLASRGYKLRTKDTLRVHFGNALEWYISLQHAVNDAVDKLLLAARDAVRGEDAEVNATDDEAVEEGEGPRLASSTPTRPGTPSSPLPSVPSTPTGRPVPPAPSRQKRCTPALVSPGEDEDEDDEAPPVNPFPEPPPRSWPSDYLISRCPACFGGLVHDPMQHVDVNRIRARDNRRPDGSTCRGEEEEDTYEGATLRVPRLVLDECERSFKAADEKREKASTKFFNDTGIMGLLCHHD
ncbi:hypothetical protein DFH09DRAFT_1090032 [Mycena vulgaris]|nr:hypothetical protein DFH09DRAFT_1090032 [Mycena vulgaris]